MYKCGNFLQDNVQFVVAFIRACWQVRTCMYVIPALLSIARMNLHCFYCACSMCYSVCLFLSCYLRKKISKPTNQLESFII